MDTTETIFQSFFFSTNTRDEPVFSKVCEDGYHNLCSGYLEDNMDRCSCQNCQHHIIPKCGNMYRRPADLVIVTCGHDIPHSDMCLYEAAPVTNWEQQDSIDLDIDQSEPGKLHRSWNPRNRSIVLWFRGTNNKTYRFGEIPVKFGTQPIIQAVQTWTEMRSGLMFETEQAIVASELNEIDLTLLVPEAWE